MPRRGRRPGAPERPARRRIPGERRQLAGPRDRAQRLLLQLGPWPHRGRGAQPGSRLTESLDLLDAGIAAREVPLEARPVGIRDRVKRIGARQGMQISLAAPHHSTPRQSRSLISPSRMRVLTVPTGTPSSPATSL